MDKYALVMVGGCGTRLWPMSRKNYPKQFVEFKDGMSLFQMTLKRLLSIFDAKRIVVVSGEPYKFTLRNQIDMLKGIDKKTATLLKANIVLEPCQKNTLPAILLGMKYLEENRMFSGDDCLFVFPSDHIIESIAKFKTTLSNGLKVAKQDKIVVFGIKPNHPKEGFGYIVPNKDNSVKKFVEKPDSKKAQKLIEQGAMWNAGIFAFKKSVMLEELNTYQNKMSDMYCEGYNDMLASFADFEKDSVDYAIMQKTKCAAVVEFTPRWTDLGSWDSLMAFYSDGKKNFSVGRSQLQDANDCLTYSSDRLVAISGVDDLIVVDSPDSILVMKKGESDKVKGLVETLQKEDAPEVKDSLTVYRPWGYYMILEERPGYKVKEIGVYPGRALSLQKHKHRSEHWNIVEGKAQIRIGEDIIVRTKNQSVYVPKNTKHKLSNPGKQTVKMIEVQIGDYLEEDDIVRYESYD